MGLLSWAKNFCQFGDHEFGDRKTLAKIESPFTELGIHVTFKTAEIGVFVGGTLLKPLYFCYQKYLLKDSRKSLAIWKTGRRYSRYPFLLGIASGPLLAAAYISAKGMTAAEARERCFRLRYNRKQLFIDRSLLVLGAIGTVWGLHGIVTWANIGVCSTVLYNAIFWDRSLRLAQDFDSDIPLGTLAQYREEAKLSRMTPMPKRSLVDIILADK